MALVPCRECGKEVSEQAPVCPYCGVKTPSAKRHKMRIYITVGIIALVIAICGFVYHRVTQTVAVNFEPAAPAKTTPSGMVPARGSKHAAAPEVKPVAVATQMDTIKQMLDMGMKPRQISKKLGIRIDEVQRIKKEKLQAEKDAAAQQH